MFTAPAPPIKHSLKVTYSLSVKMIVLILCLCASYARGQTGVNDFIGRWQVDVNESVKLMDRETKSRYDSLSSEVKSRATTSMATRVFTFNINEEATVSLKRGGEQKTFQASWTVDEDRSEITIMVEGNSVVYNYSFISAAVLRLKGTSSNGFFNSLYLVKQ